MSANPVKCRRRDVKERIVRVVKPLRLIDYPRGSLLPASGQMVTDGNVGPPPRPAIITFIKHDIAVADPIDLVPFNVDRFRSGGEQVSAWLFGPPPAIGRTRQAKAGKDSVGVR